jgi:hypothetical protein
MGGLNGQDKNKLVQLLSQLKNHLTAPEYTKEQ